MKPTLLLISIFLVLNLPENAVAASAEPGGLLFSGLRMLSAMAIVVGIMMLLHILNRKGFRFLERRTPGRIRIVETRPVGGRKSLCLVEVRGEQILLGLGNDRIDFLYHFDPARSGAAFETELKQQLESSE